MIRLEQTSAAEARSDLADANVSLDLPKMKLPLVGFHRVREPNETAKVGVPMLIEYDTTQRPLYPPEGMLMPATAIYLREAGRARLRLTSSEDEVSEERATLTGCPALSKRWLLVGAFH